MNVFLRPVQADDHTFLQNLFASTLQKYMQADRESGEDFSFREQDLRSPELNLQIIRFEEQDVGAMLLQVRNEEIFLILIEILPKYQRRGIGTTILRLLQQEASQMKVPIALRVYPANQSAQAFYLRLGFRIVSRYSAYDLMAWYPQE